MGSRYHYLLMHHARHSRLDRQLHFLRPFSRDGQIKKCIDLQGIPCINVKPGAGDDRPNPRSYQKIIKKLSKFVFKNNLLKKLKYLHPIIIPDYYYIFFIKYFLVVLIFLITHRTRPISGYSLTFNYETPTSYRYRLKYQYIDIFNSRRGYRNFVKIPKFKKNLTFWYYALLIDNI